jgi:pimeloyl-ACP methyl ester carboxylesterase
MPAYREERHDVNGIETAVLSAGEGEPLVYLHGAGTAFGFDHLLPLGERFRLVVPYHPGFGLSADDPAIDSLHDYVLHYLDLFERLGIERLSLVGESMGGNVAAWFAIEQSARVRRLVLQSPFGLKVTGHPSVDVFSIPDEELPEHLVADTS